LSEIETISRGGAVQGSPQRYRGRDQQSLSPRPSHHDAGLGHNRASMGYSSERPNDGQRLATIDDVSERGSRPSSHQAPVYEEDYDDHVPRDASPPSRAPAEPAPRSSSFLGAIGSVAGAVMRSVSHASGSGAGDSARDSKRESRDREEHSRRISKARDGPSLKVTLISASNLRCADFLGKSDPYVKVFLKSGTGDLKGSWINEEGEMKQGHQETNYIEQNLEPQWNEIVEFLDYEIGDYLYFEVWDKDFQMWQSDDILGKAEMNSNAVACGGEEVLKLQEAGDTEGKATLKVRVDPPFGMT